MQPDVISVFSLFITLFLAVSQGLFAEYIELLVQFGYLSLFSCVYPLTPLLLLINNLTEIRSDAYKICKLFRKPFSPPTGNMGVWQVSRKHRVTETGHDEQTPHPYPPS